MSYEKVLIGTSQIEEKCLFYDDKAYGLTGVINDNFTCTAIDRADIMLLVFILMALIVAIIVGVRNARR